MQRRPTNFRPRDCDNEGLTITAVWDASMEPNGRKVAWSVFVAILCVAMPALRPGAPRAVASQPAADASPCAMQSSGQWLRVGKTLSAKPGAKHRPCDRRALTT